MRNQKTTEVVNSRLASIRRYAMIFGIPLCIGLGIALADRLDMVINNPAVATAISFYLVFSIGLLWASDARHHLTMRTVSQLEVENDRLRGKAVKSDVQANYDGLTKLPNIRLLSDRFIQATERAKRSQTHLALYLVTIDDFIPINERYGVNAATKVVSTTAQRLKNVLRDTDSVVRVRSSEFIVIAESIKDLAHTQSLHQKMKLALEKPVEVNNITLVRSHIKLACATYPGDGEDLDSLIRKVRSELETTSRHIVKAKGNARAFQATIAAGLA